MTGLWPAGHFGWVFRGVSEFEGRVAAFLAQGIERDERLLFIADDPQPAQWPARFVDSGVLQIASIAEVYGDRRIIDANEQRATFMTFLEEARDRGFSGIRVAADNTSLIATSERFLAWAEWEAVADRLMSEQPVTGMCGFDRTKAHPDNLSKIVGMHGTVVEMG